MEQPLGCIILSLALVRRQGGITAAIHGHVAVGMMQSTVYVLFVGVLGTIVSCVPYVQPQKSPASIQRGLAWIASRRLGTLT